MGAFLCAFDRIVRRNRVRAWHYSGGQWLEGMQLQTPRRYTLREWPVHSSRGTRALRPHIDENARLFTHATRHYLRRRAWRYFRHLGYREPARYAQAAAAALARYRDEDFTKGEDILDSFGLMHLAFAHSAAITLDTRRAKLRKDQAVANLEPAPAHPQAWALPEAFAPLLDLLVNAKSRLARVFAIDRLRRHHETPLGTLPFEDLKRLLTSSHEDLRQIGSELFADHAALDRLPLGDWLGLLDIEDPLVLLMVCDRMQQHVTADRLDLEQIITLTRARPAPVAELGFHLLETSEVDEVRDRPLLLTLAECEAVAVAPRATDFALEALLAAAYEREALLTFLDSRQASCRHAAIAFLHAHDSIREGASADPVLWARLCETPYADVRHFVLDTMAAQTRNTWAPDDPVKHLWSTVILAVHQGGRKKPRALEQLGRTIERTPAEADRLLPVLAAALRSVRAPERRAALHTLVHLVLARPELEPATRALLPEWRLHEVSESVTPAESRS